jgi:diguanylate cyclase (GGDEF)-like protein
MSFTMQAGTTMIVRWFDRRIARPLREAVDPHGPPLAASDEMSIEANGRGALYAAVEPYRGLARELSQTRVRLRRVERETEEKIREFQEGFHRKLRRAEDKALLDPLTRLYNRAYLESELEKVCTEQKSAKKDLSIVMIDVDNFKWHNDTRGHKAGDDVLRFIGELLRGATRPSDRCVRYGGDEFVLLLPGCPARSAADIVERIIRMFRQFASTLSSEKPLSMSAGIASLADDPRASGHDLVAIADQHLYAAKRKGKNAVAAAAPK